MRDRDRKKLSKAGFATPRGGAKGAYQNHVVRSNRVIIPYERFDPNVMHLYAEGYIVRLLPDQYFSNPGVPRPEFSRSDSPVVVGGNAFVLYRTHDLLVAFPPLLDWEIRGLTIRGQGTGRRLRGVQDTGHYVLRLSTAGAARPARARGDPQGIFAPEYADREGNYLCQCVLAWLIVHTVGSPYTTQQAAHVRAILEAENLFNVDRWEFNGVMRRGLTTCPLCSRYLRYEELHSMLQLEEEQALENAGIQIEGATRSTIVNLFHLHPLRYGAIEHVPQKVAWGHAVCNTKLGQRRCYPMQELIDTGLKIGVVTEDGTQTFGWISTDWEMIRSPLGSVWVRLCGDTEDLEPSSDAQVLSDISADEVE